MSPRKVIYVCPNAKRGGAEQGMTLFLKHHDPAKWRGMVYFLNDGPLIDELRGLGYAVRSGAKFGVRLRDPISLIRVTRDLAGWIRSENAALVHGVMSYGHLIAGPAGALAGVPRVWFQHGPPQWIDRLSSCVPADATFFNSKYMESRQGLTLTRRGKVIYPGIEPLFPETYAAESRVLRAGWDLAPGQVAVGLPGRLSPMKGHRVAIDALARGGSAKLIVIGGKFLPGDDEYERELRAQIQSLGLGNRVIFTGHLSPPYAAMAACDVLLNASVVPEPFAATVIEAMMLAKPVLVPRAGGSLEAIEGGKTGEFFELGSAASLADAVSRVVSRSDRGSTMGASARARALEAYTIQRMVRELEAEYESVTVS